MHLCLRDATLWLCKVLVLRRASDDKCAIDLLYIGHCIVIYIIYVIVYKMYEGMLQVQAVSKIVYSIQFIEY